MIIGEILSNLGNQLFCYVATRSIALDLGREYRYCVIRPSFCSPDQSVDANNHEYRRDFEQPFGIDTSQRIEALPSHVVNRWTWCRQNGSGFNQDVYKVSDDTVLSGFFICPQYFEHRREEVRKWLAFEPEYRKAAEAKYHALKDERGASHLVSVHVRLGDFRRWGLALDIDYQRSAMQHMRSVIQGEKICFVLFSESIDEAAAFLSADDVLAHRGNVFEDLCLMARCDSHIISNSTLSWWGAWLDGKDNGLTIRPSLYPLSETEDGPQDIFPSRWTTVRAKREEYQQPAAGVKLWGQRIGRIVSRLRSFG